MNLKELFSVADGIAFAFAEGKESLCVSASSGYLWRSDEREMHCLLLMQYQLFLDCVFECGLFCLHAGCEQDELFEQTMPIWLWSCSQLQSIQEKDELCAAAELANSLFEKI